jgi:hypothetical protein
VGSIVGQAVALEKGKPLGEKSGLVGYWAVSVGVLISPFKESSSITQSKKSDFHCLTPNILSKRRELPI